MTKNFDFFSMFFPGKTPDRFCLSHCNSSYIISVLLAVTVYADEKYGNY